MSINTHATGSVTTATSLSVDGTAGTGFVELQTQTVAPATPAANSVRTYATGAGDFAFVDDAGFSATLALSGLSAARTYTFPNVSTALVGTTATQVLTNKTILASGGNTVETTLLTGSAITGTPTAGQFLQYGGTTWSPATLAASAPATLTGNTIGVTVGSGGVASFADPRFTDPRVIRVKNTSAGFGEFTSVVTALASITDNSISTRYIISVGAGIFIEAAIVMKPYVYLVGDDRGATILRPFNNSITLLTAAANSSIQNVTLEGIGWIDGTSRGIELESVADSYVTGVNIKNFHTPIYMRANTAACDVVINDYLIDTPHFRGIYSHGVSPASNFNLNAAVTNGRIRCDAGVQHGMQIDGAFSKVTVAGFRIVGASTGDGIRADDGCIVQVSDGKITGCNTGLNLPNVGAGVVINTRNVLFLDNVADISQAASNASGVISGQADRNKVSIASPDIIVSYLDIEQPAAITTGQFIYAPANDAVLTDTGPLIVQTGAVGCFTGCEIAFASGFDVVVTGSSGYVINLTASFAEYIRQISWPTTYVTVPASSITYVWADENGVQSGASLPDPYITVLIGRVISGAVEVEIVDTQLQSNLHPDTNSFTTQRSIGGVVFESGAITSIGGGNSIDVTAGVRYFANNRIPSAGGTGLTYADYYRDGVGGWTRDGGQTAVSALYDNNSGTPIAIPAGKFARYLLYLTGEASAEQYMLVYGQAVYDSEAAAAADSTTIPPTYFNEGITAIASLVSDDAGTITVHDIRTLPRTALTNGPIASVTDHGDLTGLGDDDHLQYLLVNGTRAMTGDLNMGTNDITSVGFINSIDITAHGSRHLPNGADALATAAPLADVSGTSINATGTANSFARSDHTHALDVSAVNLNSLTGVLDVSSGGTGASSLTNGFVVTGGGLGPLTATKAAVGSEFAGTLDTQTLSNKTLTAPNTVFINGVAEFRIGIIGSGITNLVANNAGTINITLPTIATQLVGNNTTDTLTNKVIDDPSNTVNANYLGGILAPTVAPTIGQILYADTVLTSAWGSLNSITGTLNVAKGGTGVANLTSGRVLIGAGTGPVDLTKAAPSGDFVGTTDTQTMSNKTLTAASLQIRGAGVGDNITFVPSGETSIVSGGAATLSLPSGTRTLVARDTTDTFTNKTITATSNSVSANLLRNATGNVDIAAAAAPTVGQVLTATGASAATWQTPSSAPVTFSDSVFAVYDSVDNTKQVRFDAAGTTSTSTTIVSQQTANISVTLPDTSTTLVGRDTTDTMSNKTLTSPVISTIVNTGTLTLPTSTDTLVGRATTDTLTNKTLTAASTLISGTGSVNFSAGGTATTTFSTSPTVNNVITFPTSSDTLVGQTTTDILLNKTLSMATTTIRDAFARDVVFTASGTASTVLTLTSALTASRALAFPDISDTLVTKNSTDTFTNKSITGNGTTQIVDADRVRTTQISAIAPTTGQVLTATSTTTAAWSTPSTSSLTGVLTVPQGGTGVATLTSGNVLVGAGTSPVTTTKAAPSGDFVGTTDTQTLSGKTLTAPVISTITNTGTLTLPTTTDTLVGRATTDTFTNKTITSTTNTVAAQQLHNATGVVSVSAAAAPTAGQLLTATAATTGAWVNPSFSSTLFAVVNSVDSTKRVLFDVTAGAATNTTTTFTFAQGNNRTITVPDQNFTMAGTNNIQTFTNKTIGTGNNVSARALLASGNSVIVDGSAVPTAGQILTATGASSAQWADPVMATTFTDDTFAVYDNGAPSKRFLISVGPGTLVNTSTTFTVNQTADRVVSVPDATFTMVGADTTQTLTNKTVDTATFTIQKTGVGNIVFDNTVGGGSIVTTITASSSANRVITLPNATTTLVGTDATQTLTNKTLTAPVISTISNTGTLTLPTATTTIVGRNTTDTLTNKTLSYTTSSMDVNLITGVTVSGTPSGGRSLICDTLTTASWQALDLTLGPSTTGTLAVAKGGTGRTTHTSGNFLTGNGTGDIQSTLATPTGAVVGTSDTQTLTNKTLTFGTNTINVNTITSVVVSGTPATDRIILATSASTATWQAIPKVRSFLEGTTVVSKTSAEAATYVSVTNTDTQGVIVYRGSATIDITAVSFRAACTAGASVFSARLRDITNSLDIATFVGTINSTTQTIYSTTTIANIPTGNVALQLQTEFVSGSGSVTFTGWSIQLAA